MKSLESNLDKALGRISGGLYIITAKKGNVKSAMLASWVSQASFISLGVSIAVSKDRAIESPICISDTIALNILEETNYQPLVKDLLRRFPPGADRFPNLITHEENNSSVIFADALAYVECEVISRMDAGDHWLVYSIVDAGKVK